MLNKAAPAERAKLQAALDDGSIQIKPDTQDVLEARGDTSYLEFEGKKPPEWRGSQGIENGLKQISSEAEKKPSAECIFLRPGQYEAGLDNIPAGNGGVTIENRAPGGYGPRFNPAYPPSEFNQSPTNRALRDTGNDLITAYVNKTMAAMKQADGKTTKIIIPSLEQATEFAPKSQGAGATYKVGAESVVPGAGYIVGQTYPKDPATGSVFPAPIQGTIYQKGVVFDESCTPKETPFPGNSSGQSSNPFGGSGGGGGLGGGGLGGGGLDAILPLLMQGLLGGGRGQGAYGQNPYGNSQYPYQPQYQPQDCTLQLESPVCGADGKTYKNSCFMGQANVGMRQRGVCPGATVTPNVAELSSRIVNELTQSGIPQSILENVRNAVTRAVGSVLNGGATTSETIVR
jgi:hypothetical protein